MKIIPTGVERCGVYVDGCGRLWTVLQPRLSARAGSRLVRPWGSLGLRLGLGGKGGRRQAGRLGDEPQQGRGFGV
jgi:hypothetical protein